MTGKFPPGQFYSGVGRIDQGGDFPSTVYLNHVFASYTKFEQLFKYYFNFLCNLKGISFKIS